MQTFQIVVQFKKNHTIFLLHIRTPLHTASQTDRLCVKMSRNAFLRNRFRLDRATLPSTMLFYWKI